MTDAPGPFDPPPVESPPPPRRRPPARRGRRLPSRGQVQRRRLTAALVALVVVASIVIGAFGVPGGGGGDDGATAPVSEQVGKLVRGLSEEEKVDTVLAVGFAGTGAGAGSAAGLAETQGGVVIEPENWGGAGAGRQLISALRRESEVPPLIIGLQEGGDYRAYPDLPPADREIDIGDKGDPALAESWATETGAALKKAGFDLNLSPVADVATLDSPIADRAFGDDAEAAAAMTAAAIRGCRAAQIACAVSHFPGEGAASTDTDKGPATVGIDEVTLKERDLAPFRAAFEAGAQGAVLSHAFYAAYDAVKPASQVPEITEDLLRGELGFKGIAITDDLSSGAISGGENPAGAAVRSLVAGADLILVSDPIAAAAARKALLEAVKSGEVPGDRLDQAASRVLELKKELGLV